MIFLFYFFIYTIKKYFILLIYMRQTRILTLKRNFEKYFKYNTDIKEEFKTVDIGQLYDYNGYIITDKILIWYFINKDIINKYYDDMINFNKIKRKKYNQEYHERKRLEKLQK
jgi:hypothetical protein